MPFLIDPPVYLSVADFKAQGTDYDLTVLSDAQIGDLLIRASGKVDAFLRRSFLPQEETIRYLGDGSNVLMLREAPVIWVKRIQFVLPGLVGFSVPVNQILVDYNEGELLEYTPLMFQGLGYASVFPRDMPIDVQVAWGYNFPLKAPDFSTADVFPPGSSSLAPGTYALAITTASMVGETTATPRNVTTTTGAILATITPVPGAYKYKAYIGDANAAPADMVFVDESPATTYGGQPISITLTSRSVPAFSFAESLPTTDKSARPYPKAVLEAVRLLAFGILWEDSNLANRGLFRQRSGEKELSWRSTEGTGGKGISYAERTAGELLRPYSLNAIF